MEEWMNDCVSVEWVSEQASESEGEDGWKDGRINEWLDRWCNSVNLPREGFHGVKWHMLCINQPNDNNATFKTKKYIVINTKIYFTSSGIC